MIHDNIINILVIWELWTPTLENTWQQKLELTKSGNKKQTNTYFKFNYEGELRGWAYKLSWTGAVFDPQAERKWTELE